jgi:hypothetical protein
MRVFRGVVLLGEAGFVRQAGRALFPRLPGFLVVAEHYGDCGFFGSEVFRDLWVRYAE